MLLKKIDSNSILHVKLQFTSRSHDKFWSQQAIFCTEKYLYCCLKLPIGENSKKSKLIFYLNVIFQLYKKS